MGRYFTDEKGHTFRLTSEGRAAYPLGVEDVSPARPATPAELFKFKRRQIAVWAVVQRFLPLCYKLAKGSEELVHEVGIPCVLNCLAQHDPLGAASFGTYLYSALRRRYAGWYRRPQTVEQFQERAAIPEPEFDDTVQYIMDRLDEYDRALLVLRFWEGMTLQEIADVIGSSKATVSVELRRALERARDVRRTP